MAKTYSLLLNIKADAKETSDGKNRHNYSFKAWKDGKITKNAIAFDWTPKIVKNQAGNMEELGKKIFSVIQDVVTKKRR